MMMVANVIASLYIVVYMLCVGGVLFSIEQQGTDYWDVFYSLGAVRTAGLLIAVVWLILA